MILSEKHIKLQKLFREFAEKEFTQELIDRLDSTGEFDRDIYRKMAEAGFMGARIPVKYGGQGWDLLSYVLMMEEFARVSPVLSIYANTANSLGSGPLLTCASEAQRMKYLPDAAAGKSLLAFCLTEPDAGSDAGGITTCAVDCGEYYLLNGRKRFASGASAADYALVFARTDPAQRGSRGISLFIVDMKLAGVECGEEEDKIGLRGYPLCDISFRDVRVPKDCLLGPLNGGFAAAMKTLDSGRLGIAAQALGIAQGCLDEAVSYAGTRRQFGKTIGSFEGVSFMIADMATELQAARELVYSTAILKDANDPESGVRCAMSKYFATEMCNRAAYKTVQIFGGYGCIKGCKAERLYRDARITSIYEGTSQIQQKVIANSLLKEHGGHMHDAAADAADAVRRMKCAVGETKGEVVVAVGMGIAEDSERGLRLAQKLADAFGGWVGCTRDVVERGWLAKEHMIGQTGKTVRPKLYIALGASGAVQHQCGMNNSGFVVAVNTDPCAPIAGIADVFLQGDLFDIVPELIRAAEG